MKDLDLVIKKPKNMCTFVRFLIHAMNTLDGNRGSSEKIKQSIYEERNLLLKDSKETKQQTPQKQAIKKINKMVSIHAFYQPDSQEFGDIFH